MQFTRRTAAAAAAPWRWLTRACRVSGSERAALTQSVKATVAALVAWVVAAYVLEFPQPFLAPWAALFIIEATVYRSVRSAVQQVCAVVVAVLLSSAAVALLPWELAAIGMAVFLGLVIGQWQVFGSSGPWIGVTALLILTSGTMQDTLLIDRLIETTIGVVIGLIVNTVVLPPSYPYSSADAIRCVAAHIADTVESMGRSFRDSEPAHVAMSGRNLAAVGLLRRAEDVVGLDNESRRLNPHVVTGRARRHTGDDAVLEALRSSWSYVEEIGRAIESAMAGRHSMALPDDRSRQLVAEGLSQLGDGLRSWADGAARDTWAGAFDSAGRIFDELEEQLETSTDFPFGTTTGLVAITVPARHVLRELETVFGAR